MTTRSATLRTRLMQRNALVVPGCHDALSARIAQAAGFEAVQVSGFGLAGSLLGAPDVGLLDMKDIIEATDRIARAVDIPVMTDLDTGGGNAVNAARATESALRVGAAGMNIEDQDFPKRCGHMAGKQVIPAGEMAGKVRACAEVRDRLDPDFIINARTDSFATDGLDEAIRRCNLYLEAGADLVFIDAIGSRADIERAVREIDGPLSVNLMDAVTGVRTELIPIDELAALGVARVSIPVASVLVTHRALTGYFEALAASPTGLLCNRSDLVTPFDDYTRFVGLDAVRELENRYLPAR